MTDDNVVKFPDSKRPPPEQVAAKKREARARDITRLRAVLNKNRPMPPDDQIIVAQALRDLLDRIERQYPIKKDDILREAGIGIKSAADPRGHLSEYAIRKNIPLEKVPKRLRKKTGPYKAIAEAVARLAREDAGEILFEVFQGAGFWQQDVGPEAPPEFDELAWRLRLVAEGVSARYELSKFFREVEKAGVSPVVTSEPRQETNDRLAEKIAINFSSDSRDVDADSTTSFLGWPIEQNQFTWLCRAEDGGDLPAYPLVILGTWVIPTWDLGAPLPVSSERIAKGWPAVVLSFGIVPVGKERSATAVLRVDVCAFIHFTGPKKLENGGTGFGTEDGFVPLRQGRVTLNNYDINIEHVPTLVPPFTHDHIELHASDTHWKRDILFLPINGTVCKDWLNFASQENLFHKYDRSVPHPALGEPLYVWCGLVAPFSSFGGDTLAGIVDAALCDPTNGLDRLLEEQVKRLKDAFDESQTAARNLRKQNWELIESRWSASRDDNCDPRGTGS
jgi:hypothetical protein